MNTTFDNEKPQPSSPPTYTVEGLAAMIYHHSIPEWTGEFDFYQQLARETKHIGPVLEVACGTGRIANHLALQEMQVTGFDLSPEMLEIARRSSAGSHNVRWELADMRSFDMGERYGLILIPGHSFQFMLTTTDQLSCLAAIKLHLLPGGRFVVHLDHQDLGWLWDLYNGKGGVFEKGGEVPHPESGNPLAVYRAWSYEPATQTAFVTTVWEELDANGNLLWRWERGPIALHCIFRSEMEHLLCRAGFRILAVYGNFERTPLQNDSSEMIWLAGM